VGEIPSKSRHWVPTEVACLLLGSVLAVWYAWIMDDAYVYFRYVDNWVIHGLGLVYNEGEFVEGFTSPFWALLLSGLRFLGLNYWLIVRAVGLVAFGLFWWLAVQVNEALAGDDLPRSELLNVPLVYLTCSYGVMSYFTSGLESPFVIVAAAGFALFFCRPGSTAAQSLVGLSPMIRHELAIPFAIAVSWFAVRERSLPKVALFSCGATMGAYEVFRIWYYADLVPNSFYLKDEVSIVQGLKYVYDTAIAYDVLPYLAAAALIAFATGSSRSDGAWTESPRKMMLLCAAPVLLYVIKIGGDPRHFRFLAFPFCLAVLATGGLAERLVRQNRILPRHALIATVIFGLAAFSNYPRQLLQHPILRKVGFDHRAFMKINEGAAHRFTDLGLTPSWNSDGPFLSYENSVQTYARRDEGPVMTTSWCQTAYFMSNRSVIHGAGLTEPFLARVNVESDRPAHKLGLKPLGEQLASIRNRFGFGRGVFARAVAAGAADAWIADQLDKFERIEAKAYNEHDLFGNIALATDRIGRIDPPTPAAE
jgi:hypothetical protein